MSKSQQPYDQKVVKAGLKSFPVLGIESSCDETGVAIYCLVQQRILAEALFSQVDLHKVYGGVVPELASRDHIKRALPMVQQVLSEANIAPQSLAGIAYTAGPGLMGALLVGAMLGRTLAYGYQVPSIAVHHMEGHLLAPMIADKELSFPFLGLLVSGGHSQIVLATALGEYETLGDTLDDAVGEAFDKVATLLDLSYPGGPELEQLALKGTQTELSFPRPLTKKPGLDFSFSGLKTHVLQTVKQHKAKGLWEESHRAEIAYAFQQAAVDCLRIKCERAIAKTGVTRLVVAGGVSANRYLREQFQRLNGLGVELFYPPQAYCTDNGAMIAYAGACRLLAGQKDETLAVATKPRWSLEQLKVCV